MSGILAVSDLAVEFLVSGSFERKNSGNDNEEKDTQSPYISWLTSVLFFVYDLRSHVTGSSTKDFNLFHWLDTSTEAKINQFRSQLIIQDYIFKLYISMGDLHLMDVCQGLDQWFYNLSCVLF